jgi:ATPase subunit of ABC transporter with duplicated ATPase domains
LLIGSNASDPDAVARVLAAHKFPFALAQRPLTSLSPGERVRAALICLFERRPCVQALILDEPTEHLDFVGARALEAVLGVWRGGLVVVSHDRAFLDAVGVDQRLHLHAQWRLEALPEARRTHASTA